MATPIPEGHTGNLTPEQEEKLRKLWYILFQLTNVVKDDSAVAAIAAKHESVDVQEDDVPKKKRFGMFRKKNEKSGSSTAGEGAEAEDDKYGLSKAFTETLQNYSPDLIRDTVWSMVKCDHPDTLVLRFLRARKWDVEKALIMMISTMSWRMNEMHVDDDIMKEGEAGAIRDEKEGDTKAKQLGHDFMEQVRYGKSIIHGIDREGRPICVVRVRLHKPGEQEEKSLERYTVYIIETARLMLTPPVDTATIVFDMTGFTLANMDYAPIKFLIKCFEANYPESLGAILVHNAPWVFQGIWRIIRGWLDPVVASKVHFTNNKEMTEFIEPSRMIKELGGDEDWEYEYIEPVAGENDKMKDIETKNRLLKEHAKLVDDYENATLQWIEHFEGDEARKINDKRESIADQMKELYWKLDPYLRARSLYDRRGDILPGGQMNWYPKTVIQEPAATVPTDDVD